MEFSAGQKQPIAASPIASKPNFLKRLLSKNVGGMLVRNTVVSCGVFAIGLLLLWVLVQWAGWDETIATAISFLVANSLHYILGRTWIFRGTDRSLRAGYILFLINSGIGLVITVSMFAALTHLTEMHYLLARIIVSIFAGLAVFVLNASFNFKRV